MLECNYALFFLAKAHFIAISVAIVYTYAVVSYQYSYHSIEVLQYNDINEFRKLKIDCLLILALHLQISTDSLSWWIGLFGLCCL